MKPILQAVIAAALATGGLTANEPQPGAPPVKPEPAVKTPGVIPPKPEVPNPLVPPPKAEEPPAQATPAKHDPKDAVGVGEIKKKGPLHFAAGNDLPLNAKVVIYGEDGAKQREVVYKDGQIQSWTEWHANNVKIERTYAGGQEVKRTGWQGDRKWFEISFAAAGGEKPDGGTPVDPPKETTPEKKGEEPKEPTEPTEPEKKGEEPKESIDPTEPEKKGEEPKEPTEPPEPEKKGEEPKESIDPTEPGKKDVGPTVIPDPTKNDEADPKGESPTPKKTEPVVPGDKPNGSAKVTDHKWPAFVPGNPVFPGEEPPTKPQEDKGAPHEKPGASSNLNKLQDALRVKPKDESPDTGPAAKPVEGSTLLAGAPDFLEIRSNRLIYSKDANEPFTGKSVLFEIVKEATGEFKDGHPITKETAYKRFEGEISNGRREGLGVEFYPDGVRKYVGIFKGGVLHDGWVYWYYPGTTQRKMETNYKNGQIIDSRIWNRDGTARW